MKRFGLGLFLALALVDCGGGDGGGPPVITAVVVAGDSTVVIAGTRQLTATAMAGSTPVSTGVTFQWTSSDTTRATVASTGLVSGVRLGTASITARAVVNGSPTTVSSTPHAIRVRIGSISFLPTALQFSSLGDTVQLSVVARDALNAPMGGVTFTVQSRAPSVATATLTGPNEATVVAVANGTARIVATGDGMSDSVTATVQQVAQTLSITPDTVTFGRIDSVLNPILTASDPRGNAIPASRLSWTSQATAVATVSSLTGAITSKNEGQTRVIASSGSHADTVRVGVALVYGSVQITNVLSAVIDSAVITRLNGSLQLGLEVRDVGGAVVPNPQGIAWSLKTGTVASIGAATGLVTGNANTGRDTVVVVARTARDSVPLIVRQDVATVVLSPGAPPALNFVGDTQHFTAEARDGGGAPIPGKTFTWSSGDNTKLTVDAAGLATAAAATGPPPGVTVAVRATADLVMGSVNIAVQQIAKTTDAVQVSAATLGAFGRTATATCTVRDTADVAIPGHACNWEVLSAGVVTINPINGVSTTLTAVGNGTATIKATAAAAIPSPPFNFNSITVNQVPATVTITPANLAGPPQLRTGQTAPFFAVVRDSLGNLATQDTARWSTNNAPVATVDSLTGVVTTSSAGSVTLTATATPASATRDVTVVATGISYVASGIRSTLNGSCTSAGCHNATSQLAGLILETASSYANLFEQGSTESPMRRVRAFRPDSSYLVHKLQGTQDAAGGSGVRMPEGCPGTRPCLPDATIDLIRNWILQGALNN